MRRARPIAEAAAVFALALLLACAAGAQSLDSQRARFDRETDPVHKAKLMLNLGEAQFQQIRRNVRDGQFPEALTQLMQYQKEAQECEKALNATGTDAGKHSGGFRELEISVRESLRRLNEMVHGMASDEQQPFLTIREQLSDMDQRLVLQLFPKRS